MNTVRLIEPTRVSAFQSEPVHEILILFRELSMQKYSNTKGQKYLDCMQRVHVFCLKLHGVSIKGTPQTSF